MKQVIVGNYSMGCDDVQIVLREGDGGEFWTHPEVGAIARVKVGAAHTWNELVGVLLHEVIELQMTRLGYRLTPAPDYAKDNGSYVFLMTHTQFSEVVARCADCIAPALPDLATAFKKFHRKRKNNLVKKTKT